MAANYYPILQAVQQVVNGLALVDWDGVPLPVAIRKAPVVGEGDTLPLLLIVPRPEPPKRKPIAFGPIYQVEYPADLVFIAPGNRDFTTHMDIYMGWEGAVAAAFDLPASLKSSVPAIRDVNVRPGLTIDPAQMNDNYDYGGLTIDAITTETN